ncbi:hypothetical protein K402DRAFT_418868 [Aulographum hederae CBS 113979]|uniref:Up-regulated during septation protein 1 domain-containing protein n=1 Tax=Aulographum hederae CBS 113979 TaxID=1176131 RepID=A0A6G1H7P1_9PEZI|nr:hypothetical protein K402DRAFT_418868 [Aulographum hederae CBS 113979]
MTTVQEASLDSPTIPGMPPLHQIMEESCGHSRSSSAPGSDLRAFHALGSVQKQLQEAMEPAWAVEPFVDADIVAPLRYTKNLNAWLDSSMPGTPFPRSHTAPPLETQTRGSPPAPLNPTKPLSPILSPALTPRPVLRVATAIEVTRAEREEPPEVPPKSPSTLASKSSKQSLDDGIPSIIIASMDMSSATTPKTAFPVMTPPNSGITGSIHNSGHSRASSEGSILDRGRPVKRKSKKESSTSPKSAGGNSTLPNGVAPADALIKISERERQGLHKQALEQVERYEILRPKNVSSLSKELRALDDRCAYLRKTYKSLRAGRQKLHKRMINYLRSETLVFSKEALLRQEEALVELDASIDDWIAKLEYAENRRLRVRQKLLEHVAASMTLNGPGPAQRAMACVTPPGSPTARGISPSRSSQAASSPPRAGRRDIESIKVYAEPPIYADHQEIEQQIYTDPPAINSNLFSDIELAVARMCEAC